MQNLFQEVNWIFLMFFLVLRRNCFNEPDDMYSVMKISCKSTIPNVSHNVTKYFFKGIAPQKQNPLKEFIIEPPPPIQSPLKEFLLTPHPGSNPYGDTSGFYLIKTALFDEFGYRRWA